LFRYLLIILVLILTIYAPLELTRMIMIWNSIEIPNFRFAVQHHAIWELLLIWIPYLIAILVLVKWSRYFDHS